MAICSRSSVISAVSSLFRCWVTCSRVSSDWFGGAISARIDGGTGRGPGPGQFLEEGRLGVEPGSRHSRGPAELGHFEGALVLTHPLDRRLRAVDRVLPPPGGRRGQVPAVVSSHRALVPFLRGR